MGKGKILYICQFDLTECFVDILVVLFLTYDTQCTFSFLNEISLLQTCATQRPLYTLPSSTHDLLYHSLGLDWLYLAFLWQKINSYLWLFFKGQGNLSSSKMNPPICYDLMAQCSPSVKNCIFVPSVQHVHLHILSFLKDPGRRNIMCVE